VVDNVLTLHGIRKSYNVGKTTETEVLHGVDLQLAKGEFCALIGPSGSGKSTLLNIVGLLDRPTQGSLVIEGHETNKLDDRHLTKLRGSSIGFVFQYHHLLSAFTALENVMMPLLVQEGFLNDDMRRRAEELLAQVGLTKWQNNSAMNISGGQQQRVAIARALAVNPSIVLADEPTGNLDSKSADQVFELMRNVNKAHGTSFLIVTHNMSLAKRCDRTIEVVDGQIA
jgi:lipoprotein-releasing system ATP-binding protein